MTLSAAVAALAAKTAADQQYRLAVVAAVGEHGAAAVALELGVSRQAVYQLVRRAAVEVALPADPRDVVYDADGHLLPQGGPVADEGEMRARLEEIDARYDAVVDALAQREVPSAAFAKRDQAFRNAQAGKRRRKGLAPLRTVKAEVRWHAESVLLKFLEDNRGVVFVERVLVELDEAAGLRESLAALEEARRGF